MGEGLKIQTMLYSPYEFSPSVGIYSRGGLREEGYTLLLYEAHLSRWNLQTVGKNIFIKHFTAPPPIESHKFRKFTEDMRGVGSNNIIWGRIKPLNP